MRNPGPKVHFWVHDLFAVKGGIQAYSRHLVDALQRKLGAENLQIFSKNDAVSGKREISGSRWKTCGSWPGKLRDFAFAFRTVSEGLRQRPDLVIMSHLNFSPVAFWLTRLTGTPYWCVAHGVDAWGLKREDRVRGVRSADRVLAVSTYTRQRLLQEQNLDPDRVRILPNTFRAEAFRPAGKSESLRQRHSLGPNKRILLTVARMDDLEKYKGYDQILRALPQILKEIPEAHYILVGDGDDRGRIEQLLASLGLGRFVTLAGRVPDTELCDYYNLCDVFAMPSKGEGFGIVYLEALACGKPVLAGNADGSSDPLLHGQLGVLVNPDNVPEIADSLISILKGTYPLPVLYRPDELRQRTIEAFGLERFFSEVSVQLDDFQRQRRQRTSLGVIPSENCPETRA